MYSFHYNTIKIENNLQLSKVIFIIKIDYEMNIDTLRLSNKIP